MASARRNYENMPYPLGIAYNTLRRTFAGEIQVRLHLLTPSPAAIAIYFASVVGLIENVVIFYSVTRNRPISLQLALYSLFIIIAGGIALGLVGFLGGSILVAMPPNTCYNTA